MTKINPSTPTEVRVQPLAEGGTRVDVFVPTYGGGLVLTVEVERDEDGDWRVFLPTATDLDRAPRYTSFDPERQYADDPDFISFLSGISYFGAPDAEYDRLPSTELHTN